MRYVFGLILIMSLALNGFAVKALFSLLDASLSKAEYQSAFNSCRDILESHDRAVVYYRRHERAIARAAEQAKDQEEAAAEMSKSALGALSR